MRGKGFARMPLAALVVGLVVYTFASGCRAAGPNKAVPPEQQRRLETLQEKGAAASLTILPAVLWDTDKPKVVGDMGQDIAKVVGLMLEQAGMDNLELSQTAFLLPAEKDFDNAADPLGAFVRENPLKTDYALYAEFLGRAEPQRFEEVRAVIVDKNGEPVWVDRQGLDDRDFKRIKPDCPMECCVLLAKRVRGILGLAETAKRDTGEGKFARMFAESSPAPDEAEWDAMERRQEVMKRAGSTARVDVYPVRLSNDEVSTESAALLATLLGDKKLFETKAVKSPLRVEIKPARNEQKLLWDLARAFQDHVKSNPPEADYTLLTDYIMHPRSGRAWAVHFVVCDRDGEWVIVDFQNDHHDDFQSIDPKTHDGCGRLVARRLEGYLR